MLTLSEVKVLRIYVAGKLNDMACDYIKNCHRMIWYRNELARLGFAPYCPCLDILCGLMFGSYGYEEYFQPNQPWIDVSDALFLIPGWETSAGTAREIARAKKVGVPIFTDLEELLKWKAERESVSEELDRDVSGVHA